MYANDEIERQAPLPVRRLLLDFGGVTPTGRPMWRLVRAGDCRILCRGRMHHFARGKDLDLVRDGPESVRPERIQGGEFLSPRYRDIAPTWWILQKWFPPRVWGTVEQWREHRSQEDGMRLFAQAFPESGDYLMLAGPWASPEEAGDLRAPIRQYLRVQLSSPKSLEAMVAEEMAEEVRERERQFEELARQITQAEVELAETWKSKSLDAQRVREQMAARAGVTGHFGASEAWG